MAKKKVKKQSRRKTARQKSRQKPIADSERIPAWYSVTDLKQLEILANPKRQKILGEFVEEARTTKQVAEILGEPPTRLYHHVDALARHGLLVLEREVPKRGTTEKYYRAVARQFRVDESCLADPAFVDENTKLVTAMLDEARVGLFKSLEEAAADPEEALYSTATSGLINATEKDIEKAADTLINQIDRLVNKPAAKTKSKKEPRQSYRIMLLIFPEIPPDED